METNTMGVVLVTALIENQRDVDAADEGRIPDAQVRRFEVHDARVDTGATYVSMPMRLSTSSVSRGSRRSRPRPRRARCPLAFSNK